MPPGTVAYREGVSAAAPRPGRRVGAAVACVLFALFAVPVIAPSTPALAHAGLVSVDPADGAVVDRAPETVTLTFSGPVTNVEVAVTAPDGDRLGVAAEASGRDVLAELEPVGQAGEYTVAFRVVSEDGHPIAGTSTFEATEGESVPVAAAPESDGAAASSEEGSFVHRHAEHIAWVAVGGLAAVVLILWPLLRRRAA